MSRRLGQRLTQGLLPYQGSDAGNHAFASWVLSCRKWSTFVRWCPSPSAAIVIQLVTHPPDARLYRAAPMTASAAAAHRQANVTMS